MIMKPPHKTYQNVMNVCTKVKKNKNTGSRVAAVLTVIVR